MDFKEANKMVMAKNEFYSVVLKKKIMIPPANIKEVVRKGRKFAVGKYKINIAGGKKKEYTAWKVLGMANK